MVRQSMLLTKDQLDDMKTVFNTVGRSHNNHFSQHHFLTANPSSVFVHFIPVKGLLDSAAIAFPSDRSRLFITRTEGIRISAEYLKDEAVSRQLKSSTLLSWTDSAPTHSIMTKWCPLIRLSFSDKFGSSRFTFVVMGLWR